MSLEEYQQMQQQQQQPSPEQQKIELEKQKLQGPIPSNPKKRQDLKFPLYFSVFPICKMEKENQYIS